MLNTIRKSLATAAVATVYAASALAADSDIVTHRSLDELKLEVVRRAEQAVYPLAGMNADDVRRAVASVGSLKRDEWARAFMAVGDDYMKRAEAEAATQPDAARKDFRTAQKLYYFGRWPAPLDSAARAASYRKERGAFMAAERLAPYEVEELRADYKGQVVTGVLGMPRGRASVPLVVTIGGLDGWKEARFTQMAGLIERGVAVLALDMPGTGESPVKLEPGADQSLIAALDKALERKTLDASRVVVYGGSFGGYWSTMLAVNLKDRLRGAVTHSGPFDATFHREQFSAVMRGDEYLFDAYPAMFALLRDVQTEDGFFTEFRRQSLVDLGYSGRPTADLLVVGGQRDTLVPTPDLLAALAMPGGIKEAWINPTGIHMGRDRSRGLLDADIQAQVVAPWIVRKLAPTAGH